MTKKNPSQPTKPQIATMKDKLEKIYKTTLSDNICPNCLLTAYNSEINDRTGYVTDEELIKASGEKLKHK